MYTYAHKQTHNRRCCSSLSLWAWLADTRQPASSGSLKAPGQFQLGCWLHRNGYMCMNACLGSVRIPSQFDRKDNALFTAMCVCVCVCVLCVCECVYIYVYIGGRRTRSLLRWSFPESFFAFFSCSTSSFGRSAPRARYAAYYSFVGI